MAAEAAIFKYSNNRPHTSSYMDTRQESAINAFTIAIRELRDAGVIRSHRYLGDIAEFLCADAFGIQLVQNLREVGHDGFRGGVKVQIKYNGAKKKNIDLGNPAEYEEIYIVLGKDSVVRPIAHDADFLVYVFSQNEVLTMRTPEGKYSCGKLGLPGQPAKAIYIDKFYGNKTPLIG